MFFGGCYGKTREPRRRQQLFNAAEQKDVIKDFLWKIRDGKLEEVREYLEEYPGTLLNENLVIHDRIYALPLAVAFKKNRKEVAEFLIGRGADMEAYCSKEGVYVKELKPKDF